MQWKVLLAVLAVSSSVLAQDKPAAEPAQPTPEVKAEPVKVEAKEEVKPAETIWTQKTLTGDWGGHRSELEGKGITFELFYNQQFQQNFRGGLDTHNGGRLTGSYDGHIILDFEKMKLIDNAGFFFEFSGSWGNGVNPKKVGALNNVNADAGGDQSIYVKKWWYWQKFFDKKVEMRLGKIETNKDLFDVSAYANHEDKDFLNRSSIRNTTIPHRKGIGGFVKYGPVDWLYVQGAVLDSQGQDRETGFNTAFHGEDHFNVLVESGVTPKIKTEKGPMPGKYRVGGWYEGNPKNQFTDTLGGRRETGSRAGDAGWYLGADQMVWKENGDEKDTQGLGVFARYGHAHQDVNRTTNYWEVGASYRGLIPDRDKDVFGFAVSQSILSERYGDEIRAMADRETAYEWYYLYQLTPWCTISPDLQVVTNPGGDKNAHDAIVGGIRIRVTF